MPPPANRSPNDLSFLDGYHFKALYTDGSWTNDNTLSSLLLGNGKVKTAGAIAVHTTRGMILIKIDMDIEADSAYDA